MPLPPTSIDNEILNRIEGSIIGMALGDALGAHVEFRPHAYLKAYPVTDLQAGGTWGLDKGQVTFSLFFSYVIFKNENEIIHFSSPMIHRWLFVWPIH